ncbi:MAG: hypothetical protein H6912_09705 [Kordiimonadaceae bacterium]|nr:hypothetical protein [Kordiimonadaceae bacterium]
MLKKILYTGLVFVFGTSIAFSDTNEERFAKEMEKYKQTGEFQNCIINSQIRRTRVLDDIHIIFEMNGNKAYLNTLDNKCPNLGFERSIKYTSRGNQLCSTDVISVLRPHDTGASCFLGKFEILEKLPRKDD